MRKLNLAYSSTSGCAGGEAGSGCAERPALQYKMFILNHLRISLKASIRLGRTPARRNAINAPLRGRRPSERANHGASR